MNTACDQCEMCFFWKYHPCRTVDYRWQEALEIVDGYRRLHKRLDDSTVQQAVKFLRALRRCSTEKQHAKLCKKMPLISAAYKLHEAGGELELELQARVLAGHTVEELAKMFGMDRAIINMYQRLFFTVADRLRARDWILMQAINIWDKTPESLIKWLGYFGGPLVLDCFLPYLLTNSRSVHKSPYSAAEAQGHGSQRRVVQEYLVAADKRHACLHLKSCGLCRLSAVSLPNTKLWNWKACWHRYCPRFPKNCHSYLQTPLRRRNPPSNTVMQRLSNGAWSSRRSQFRQKRPLSWALLRFSLSGAIACAISKRCKAKGSKNGLANIWKVSLLRARQKN